MARRLDEMTFKGLSQHKPFVMKLNSPITSVPSNVPAALRCQQVEQTPETDAHMAKKILQTGAFACQCYSAR